MDSNTLYVPEEIIRNILKRLPVKSLIRFQCVCKGWKSLIKEPSFIKDHIQQSNLQNPSLLIFEPYAVATGIHWRMLLMDCGMQLREVQKPPWMDSLAFTRIIGSCNGLLCVEINEPNEYRCSLSLWNPATTAIRYVPRTRSDGFEFYYCVTGFGFSPIANDYKIVRAYEVSAGVNRVEVFSLSRGSWKEINVGNLERVVLAYETVTANGAIFWPGIICGAKKEGEHNTEVEEDEHHVVEVIVSFDIAKEVFTLMLKPDLEYHSKLTVYENKPAILFKIWGEVHLWVMEEGKCAFGDTQSWTKISTSSSCSYILDPMTIWRNEIVCETYYGGARDKGSNALYLMDVTTTEVKRFVIPSCGRIHCIYNYVESLV